MGEQATCARNTNFTLKYIEQQILLASKLNILEMQIRIGVEALQPSSSRWKDPPGQEGPEP